MDLLDYADRIAVMSRQMVSRSRGFARSTGDAWGGNRSGV